MSSRPRPRAGAPTCRSWITLDRTGEHAPGQFRFEPVLAGRARVALRGRRPAPRSRRRIRRPRRPRPCRSSRRSRGLRVRGEHRAAACRSRAPFPRAACRSHSRGAGVGVVALRASSCAKPMRSASRSLSRLNLLIVADAGDAGSHAGDAGAGAGGEHAEGAEEGASVRLQLAPLLQRVALAVVAELVAEHERKLAPRRARAAAAGPDHHHAVGRHRGVERRARRRCRRAGRWQ